MRQGIFLVFILSLIFLTLAPPILAQDGNALWGTDWQLVSIAGVELSPNSTITLIFADDENRIGGSAGCNSYFGDYSLTDDALQFSMVGSTLMACLDEGVMESESAYLAALYTATHYQRRAGQLIITYGSDQQLVFKRLVTLPNTLWQLASMAGEAVLGDEALTLGFDVEGNFGGYGGCNTYGGVYRVDDERISFGDVFSTRRGCLEDALNQQEQALFTALQHATTHELTNDQLVITYGEAESATLVFERVWSLKGTLWQLESMDGAAVLEGTTITLQFDLDHWSESPIMGGSSGCNNYGGTYTVDGDSLSIGTIFRTDFGCSMAGVMQQEQAYIDALEAATGFELTSESLIIIYGNNQQLAFGLSPVIINWQ